MDKTLENMAFPGSGPAFALRFGKRKLRVVVP
jgi:hypothetical protein